MLVLMKYDKMHILFSFTLVKYGNMTYNYTTLKYYNVTVKSLIFMGLYRQGIRL